MALLPSPKSLLLMLTLMVTSSLVQAHYQFTALMINSASTGDWNFVRKTNEYIQGASFGNPVRDVTSLDLRCNNTMIGQPSGTAQIAAGTSLGFWSPVGAYHPGVYNIYMARAPANVSEWNGQGEVWFKVHEVAPIVTPGRPMQFPAQRTHGTAFIIPKAIPSGEYLVRIEHIALHVATTAGAEFYVSCGQVNVVQGGEGIPAPLVAIPGVYTGTEPGLVVDVTSSDPKPYAMPGPPIWYGL